MYIMCVHLVLCQLFGTGKVIIIIIRGQIFAYMYRMYKGISLELL